MFRLRLRGCEGGEGEEELFHALAFEGDGDLLVAGDDFAADDDAGAEDGVGDSVAGGEGGGGGLVHFGAFGLSDGGGGTETAGSAGGGSGAGTDGDFDIGFGEVAEEAGGRVGSDVAEEEAAAGAGEIEALLGTGHADVADAAFFFDLGGVIDGAKMWEEAFFHAGEEDDGVFEALSGVEGDEGDGVWFIGGWVVDVRDERDFFEEGGD